MLRQTLQGVIVYIREMETRVLIENPKFFEGGSDLNDYIILSVGENYEVEIPEEYLYYSDVKEKLLSLKKGDTIIIEPKSITVWKSSAKVVGVSYLKVNNNLIIDYNTISDANKHNGNKLVILLIIAALVFLLKDYFTARKQKST